jgi:predicted ATPase
VNQWLAGTEEMDCGYRLHVSDITELPSDHELTVALRTQRLEELENASAKLSTLATMKRITIVKEAGGITLMPHDIGVGLSQVIPVLVSALDGGNGLVGMEQPEIHLHPNGQAALGDIFIAGAIDSAGPRNLMIIETHSEHLILRLLRRIRETARGQAFRDTRVTPGDIGVWFVSSEDGETSVIEMGVSEQGEFLRPWPDTFFSQDFFERTA